MTELHSPATTRRQSGWTIWLIWIVATCAGVIAAGFLLSAIGLQPLTHYGDDIIYVIFDLTRLCGFAWPIIQVFSGVAQHYALRLSLPSERRWFKRTLVGTLVGIPVGLMLEILFGIIGIVIIYGGGLTNDVLGAFAAGGGVGLMVGFMASTARAQQEVLKCHSRRAGWWLFACPLGWSAGMIAAGAVLNPSNGDTWRLSASHVGFPMMG